MTPPGDGAGSGAPDERLPVPGSVDLGKYRLVREIGHGGMGVVYEAEDTLLQRRVAIKLMPGTVGLSAPLRRRFAREAKAVAKLSHANIATVFEATPDYIAMQLIDGVPLTQAPRDDIRLLVRLLRDASLAVQFAHEHNVIHRDLKPSNLMIEGLGEDPAGQDRGSARVFVMDFGLAKESSIDESVSGTGSILGTPAYMPPEQAAGKGAAVDERSDVYSMGATIYAALTGAPPFAAKEIVAVLRQVVEEEARSPRIEPDLDAIVCKCLAKEPWRRYQSAQELADDLTRWLAGESVRARPPTLRYRVFKYFARRKRIVRAVAVAVAIAVLTLGPVLVGERAKRAGAEDALRLSERISTMLDDVEILRRSGKVADTEEANRRLDNGIHLCETFLKGSEVPHAYYFLGRLLRVRGRVHEARAALDRALELDPQLAKARFERGILLLTQLGDLTAAADARGEPSPTELAAIAELRRRALGDLTIVEDRREDFRLIDEAFGAAELMRLRGDLEFAQREIERVLAMDPAHPEALIAKARIERAASGQRAAEVVDANGDDVGRVLAALGGEFATARSSPLYERLPLPTVVRVENVAPIFADYGQGDEVLENALKHVLAAGRLVASMRTVDALADWQDAIRGYDAALRANPELVGALNNRGACWAELEGALSTLGRRLEAIAAHRSAGADYSEAIRLAPNWATPYLNRCAIRLRQAAGLARFGRFHAATLELEGAIADSSEAIRLSPNDPEGFAHRARARERRFEILLEESDDAAALVEGQHATNDYTAALLHAADDWPWRALCEQRLAALSGDSRK